MTLFFVVLTVLAVLAIGLVSVGRATAGLAAAPPRSLFDLDEAVEFVADRLSVEIASQVSYDEVRSIIGWHLDYLAAKGVAEVGNAGSTVVEPVVTDEDEGVAYVLGKASESGLDVDDVAVVAVIDGEAAYLDAIGAIGGPVVHPEG